jgi:hypothetical protein
MMLQMLSKNLFIFRIVFFFSATTINTQQWHAKYRTQNKPQTEPVPEVCEKELT